MFELPLRGGLLRLQFFFSFQRLHLFHVVFGIVEDLHLHLAAVGDGLDGCSHHFQQAEGEDVRGGVQSGAADLSAVAVALHEIEYVNPLAVPRFGGDGLACRLAACA